MDKKIGIVNGQLKEEKIETFSLWTSKVISQRKTKMSPSTTNPFWESFALAVSYLKKNNFSTFK